MRGVSTTWRLDVASRDLASSTEKLNLMLLSKAAIQRAARRAVTKSARWLRTHAQRGIAGDLGIAQKWLKNRLYLSRLDRRPDGVRMTLRVYTANLPVRALGRGRATASGRQVKDKYVKGGFLAFYKSKWSGKRQEGIYYREDKERLPIKHATFPIADEARENVDRLMDRMKDRLRQVMRQELNYELVKAARA